MRFVPEQRKFTVQIEILYIDAQQKATSIKCALEPGATVGEALNQCAIYTLLPETKTLSLGIFSKKVSLHTVLKAGDRIEIYRPLTRDPKERRREIAKQSNKV